MSSTATSRSTSVMTNAVRATRFPEFGAAPGRQNSEDRTPQSTTLSQTFGNGGAWQASSDIWGKNAAIGSGLTNAKRDASRSRAVASEDYHDRPSGSGALAASSEADPWSSRTNPWNAPDTTSPTLQSSHSGSNSPSRTRGSLPNTSPQTLLEIQNQYQQSRSAVGQNGHLNRAQQKSSLDPSSGSFFVRKPSFGYQENDKENSGYANGDSFDAEVNPSRYLALGGHSRDGSMPPSRASDAGLSANGLVFRSGHPTFGSIGHTPSNSMHSQRQSISEGPGAFASSRFELPQNDAVLNEKFAKFNLGRDQPSVSQVSFTPQGMSYSPNTPTFPPTYTQSQGWAEGQKFGAQSPYANQPLGDQGYFSKVPRFGDRGSPAESDHRRALNSPKYHTGVGTPPTTDQTSRPSSGPRLPLGANELNRQIQQNIQFAAAQQAYLYQAQQAHFQGQFQPVYDFATQQFRPSYPYPLPMPTFPAAQIIPTRPAKDQDSGIGIRSALLEDFRSNAKTNKRYDLKDIYNHVVEFSGDQHGSRFIQGKLETANSDEKEQIFREIQTNALQLMTDVFGNYVIQKMFEHGNQVQKRILGDCMKNHVMELSLQMYGCRVVQKAFEHVLVDQQAELVKELKADILKCVKDQNGNHVVQKAVERVPIEHIQFIIEIFRGQTHVLAVHTYGCRVIQRILEFCKPQDQAFILEELHACTAPLIPDQYGNYVVQHIIEKGRPEDRAKAIKVVQGQLLQFCKHKYASNVVESAIAFGTPEQRNAILAQLLAPINENATNNLPKTHLAVMMADQYANYVIQTLLEVLQGDELKSFLETAKVQHAAAKKWNYNKQVVAIEKILFHGVKPQRNPQNRNRDPGRSRPININSSAPTPVLTHGQNSPQSSSAPSTSVSTIDEPIDSALPEKPVVNSHEKSCPEVIINGI